MNGGVVPYLVLGAIALVTLAVVASVSWSLGMLRQPRALVQGGHWREAAMAAERLGRSWLRVFPSVRGEAAHARAACLHLEGKLDESLAALRTLPATGRLTEAIALLEGANLVMMGERPRRAVERLELACASPRSSPEDRLFLALAKHAAGDAAGAEAIFVTVEPSRPAGAPAPRIYEPAFHYLRGLFLVKTGRAAAADRELAIAAASPITTIYVERARALTPPPPNEEADPRSSLAPQVLDE